MIRKISGRWSIRANGFKVEILDFDGRIVANLESDEFSFDEAMEDAKLIVRAPELLYQLRTMVKCMKDMRDRNACSVREVSLALIAEDLISSIDKGEAK